MLRFVALGDFILGCAGCSGGTQRGGRPVRSRWCLPAAQLRGRRPDGCPVGAAVRTLTRGGEKESRLCLGLGDVGATDGNRSRTES